MGIDLKNGYAELRRHIGHTVVLVCYGSEGNQLEWPHDGPENVAIECEDCGEVLLDFDRPPAEA